MDAMEAMLLVIDGAWKDDFESLTDAIADLTEEESVWQPPSYKREPQDEGVGRPGTILWHLNHLEMCHRHYIATLEAMDPTKSPDTAAPGELPLKQILPALEKTTGEMREAIANLGAEGLTRQVRPNRSAANFIAMIARHISWHAAQIKQTRRLHAHRPPG
ncbi:MAG: DinB family protein [Planctomycetes bacterium]|nr:DinB family protein [Planctomycetota bacterium]